MMPPSASFEERTGASRNGGVTSSSGGRPSKKTCEELPRVVVDLDVLRSQVLIHLQILTKLCYFERSIR